MVPLPQLTKKVKLLPCHCGKKPDVANPKALWVVSCQFATKVMHMGVVACPNEAHGFVGKIDLIQVATEKMLKNNMCLDNAFLDEMDVNDSVKAH